MAWHCCHTINADRVHRLPMGRAVYKLTPLKKAVSHSKAKTATAQWRSAIIISPPLKSRHYDFMVGNAADFMRCNMNVIDVNIADLKPYEKNPRKNDEAVKYVAESIKQFGFKVPIVIDRNNVIVAGHTRYKAAKKLKITSVPCIIADDLTDEQIKAYRLSDNKVSEKSEWDFDLLELELDDIFNIDMSDFGFDDSVSPDDFNEDFSLPDGDKSGMCCITFTVHEKQKELIEYALSVVRDSINETFGNSNKNGNTIYEVVRQWAEQRKLR